MYDIFDGPVVDSVAELVIIIVAATKEREMPTINHIKTKSLHSLQECCHGCGLLCSFN